MVPNRIALALQEGGWWVRSEIIWAKPNPMPESVIDRPATSHEKIWLLTRSPKYFWDATAVRQGTQRYADKKASHGPVETATKKRGARLPHKGLQEKWDKMSKPEQQANGRNLRNYEPAPVEVWNMATRPFAQAHFATFPPELVERCLKAGCPPKGHVLDPFGGAGTTGLVAQRMDLEATLIELNPEYAAMARQRIDADMMGPFEKRFVNEEQSGTKGLPMFEGLT